MQIRKLRLREAELSLFCLKAQALGHYATPTCVLSPFRRVWLFAFPGTAAHQAPLSMGFSGQKYLSGLPCAPPGDLPNPRIKPTSPALQVDSLLLRHQKSPHYDTVPSRRYSRNCRSLSSFSSLPCSPLDYQNCSLPLCPRSPYTCSDFMMLWKREN